MRLPTRAATPPLAGGLKLPEEHLRIIEQSHQRCLALGVSRIERPDIAPVNAAQLATVRQRNRRLHAHAAPVMEMLHEQIVRSQSMVVLTDASGIVIHSIGDDDFLARASKVALQPGAVWSEPAKGTNAIGTALMEEAPTLVHADEHYLHAHHFLTCSAAPMLDPRGQLLGVLDVSGDHRSYHPHTMALVKMSARMIENAWLAEDSRHLLRLHFHGRAEFIGTLMEGILAVTADGRIVGANRGALEQLKLSGASLRQHTLASLLGSGVGALVDHFRSSLAPPLQLHAPGGALLHAVARFNAPEGHALRMPAAPALALPAADAALARLCTGDARIDTLVQQLRRVAGQGVPLLIEGETGTGKDLLAQAVHADFSRGALVVLRCASATSESLALSPAQAPGSTLLLDDVDALAPPLQAQLLALLQDGAPGAALLCTTRHPLRDAVAQGRFRDDLFHRLAGLTVTLPPLRERSDLPALVRRLLDQLAPGRALQLAPEVRVLLAGHGWPGNVRQLHNVLRTAILMAGSDHVISREHLPEDFAAESPLPAATASIQRLHDLEVDAIRRAVASAGGNIADAARRLGVSRNTVYRKLRGKA